MKEITHKCLSNYKMMFQIKKLFSILNPIKNL